MPTPRRIYVPESGRQLVELARSGCAPKSLAKQFEPLAQTVRNWVAQAVPDASPCLDGLISAEREELKRFKSKNRQLKLDRSILSKAAAWFARETGTILNGSTTS